MGVDGGWSDILRNRYPETYLKDAPSNSDITVAIDNITEYLPHLMPCSNRDQQRHKWRDLFSRFYSRITNYINSHPNLRCYIVLFEDKISEPKRLLLRNNAKKRGHVTPFSTQEIYQCGLHSISDDSQIFEPMRVLKTPLMMNYLYEYLTTRLIKHSFEVTGYREVTIILVDARVKSNRMYGGDSQQQHIESCNISIRLQKTTSDYHSKINPVMSIVDQSMESFHLQGNEMKATRMISEVAIDGDVFDILTPNFDQIPILLLNMRDWISPTKRIIPFQIYVDLTHHQMTTNKITVDVRSLWRHIIVDFNRSFPVIIHPIETLCALMLFTGSDYVETCQGIDAKLVWHHFVSNGYQLLAGPIFLIDQDEPTPVIGFPTVRHSLRINEQSFFMFLSYILTFELFGDPHDPFNVSQIDTIHENIVVTQSKRFNCDDVRDIELVFSRIRRLFSNMDFWINGSKSVETLRLTEMCKEVIPHLSLYGWELDSTSKSVHSSSDGEEVKIVRSRRVFRITN